MKELGILDDILFVHPKDVQDGKVELTAERHDHEPAVSPGGRAVLRPPQLGGRARHRGRREPRGDLQRRLGRARGLRVLRRRGALPARERGDDGGRRQGRRREVQRERDPRSPGLDPAQLPDGSAHRARPLPRLPHLELRADDAADRPLPRAQRRGDPRAPGRRRARRPLPRARRGGDRADPALLHGARARRRARPPRRGAHPSDQPLHGLRAASRVHRLRPRALGPAPAEHRVRGRPLDHRPLVDASTSAG